MVPFGILLQARDATKAALNSAAAGFKKFGQTVDDESKKTKDAVHTLSAVITGLNQGMAILRKGFQLGSMAMRETVGVALEQRAAGDAQLKAMKDLGFEAERVQGAIGDILIPIILGINDALETVTGGWNEYLTANKKAIGGGIVEWLADTAHILVSGVATGVLLAAQAWFGWRQIIAGTQAVVSKLFEFMLDGWGAQISVIEQIAGLLGLDGLAESVAIVGDGVRRLSREFSTSADIAVDEMMREAGALATVQKGIDEFALAAHDLVGVSAVKAYERLGQAIQKIDPALRGLTRAQVSLFAFPLQEMARLLAESEVFNQRNAFIQAAIVEDFKKHELKTIDDLIVAWSDYNAIKGELSKDSQDEITAYIGAASDKIHADLTSDISSALQSIVSTTRSVVGSAFSDIGRLQNETVIDLVRNEQGFLEEQERIVGQHVKTVGDAFGDMAEGFGKAILMAAQNFLAAKAIEMAAERVAAMFGIQAAAAEGAAKTVAAHAGIPFVGLGIGLAAAAAMTAAILAFASFKTGGFVDRDQLAMVHAGELVVPQQQARPFLAEVAAARDRGGAVGAPAAGGGAGPTLRIEVANLAPTDNTEAKRQLERSLLPVIREWLRDGKLA